MPVSVSILAKQYMYKQYKTVPFPQAMQQQRTVNGDRKANRTDSHDVFSSITEGWGTRFVLTSRTEWPEKLLPFPPQECCWHSTPPLRLIVCPNTNPSLAVSRFPGSKQCFPPQIPGLLPLKSRLEKGAAVQNNHQTKRDHLSWDFRQRGTAT